MSQKIIRVQGAVITVTEQEHTATAETPMAQKTIRPAQCSVRTAAREERIRIQNVNGWNLPPRSHHADDPVKRRRFATVRRRDLVRSVRMQRETEQYDALYVDRF
jgi:hypothetical protein